MTRRTKTRVSVSEVHYIRIKGVLFNIYSHLVECAGTLKLTSPSNAKGVSHQELIYLWNYSLWFLLINKLTKKYEYKSKIFLIRLL